MDEVIWRKSGHSGSDGGECIELARRDGAVAIRDSKDANGPVLVVSHASLRDAIRLADEQ